MRKDSFSSNLSNWYISYNPYTDVFQMYGDQALKIDKDKYKITRIKTGSLYTSKETNEPLFIEFKDAYSHIGDIDNMSKKDIIKRVKALIAN